jgi:PAS domain S-box-containing protein
MLRRLLGAIGLAPAGDLTRIELERDREVQSRREAEHRLTHLAEAERMAGEARLRSYFEAAPQSILAVAADGSIRLVNRKTEEMFGYTRDELLGQPIELLLPDSLRKAHVEYRARFHTAPKARSMGQGMILSGRRKDGTEFPVEVGLGYVESPEGGLALGMVTDITAVSRMNAEMQRLNQELRRSNGELEQFAYVASHDLQEPLRMVTGYLQLLERRYKSQLDSDAQEFIAFAVDGAARMKSLILDLLRFSRAGTQTVELRRVSGATLLQNAMSNLSAAIEESGARVTFDRLPEVLADPGLLTQVLQNLLANAIKFRRGPQPRIHAGATWEANRWVFSVRDDGIGIDPAHLERIFRIFERLHSVEKYPGTGVGLAISKRIIERHGGTIWVESVAGVGSTFYFSLPAEQPSKEYAAGNS